MTREIINAETGKAKNKFNNYSLAINNIVIKSH